MRLGWSHGDQEIFSLDEMIKLFSLDAISKSASAFNTDKLLWLNNHYMRSLDPAYVAKKHLAWHMADQNIDTSKGRRHCQRLSLPAGRALQHSGRDGRPEPLPVPKILRPSTKRLPRSTCAASLPSR